MISPVGSPEVLERARAGQQDAFRELITPYLSELHVHCYRMLGSLIDADELVQETLLAAWQGLSGFRGDASVRTWLYRIATTRCLNAIRDGRRRPPPAPVPPFAVPEPTRLDPVTWLQPYPDALLAAGAGPEQRYQARETIELAFVVALQLLPPRQTATVILRDVLDFSTEETAHILDMSPGAAKAALQRGRAALRAAKGTEPRADLSTERDIARRFAAALVADDIPAVIELLTSDAWLSMPPAPHAYHGQAAIAAFFTAVADWRAPRALRLAEARANAAPAFASYVGDDELPTGYMVLEITADGITRVTRFLDPALLRRLVGDPQA